MAVLKRWQFGKRSEKLNPAQRSLLEETIDADLEAIERELEALQTVRPAQPKAIPRRTALPAHLPRREVPHEPDSTVCSCGCQLERVGDEISERLDYTPGSFEVERHVRGKWVCRRCEILIQEPMPAQIIDKGIPTAGLLAHILVSKFADHTPLYRLAGILDRADVVLPPSTLGGWVGVSGFALTPLVEAMKADLLTRAVLHADETPVAMLKPGLIRTKPTSGATAARSSRRRHWWYTTLPRVAPVIMHAIFSGAGTASLSAMTSLATRRYSAAVSPKSDAQPTRGASSSSSKIPSAANWRAKRCFCMAYCTTWRPLRVSSSSMRPVGNGGGNNMLVRWQITYASG